MTGKVEKGGKPIQTIQQQLAEIALKGTKAMEGGCYDEEVGACSSIQNQSMMKRWKGRVFVEFSPVNIGLIKECGRETTIMDKDGNTYFTKKYVNVLEWEWYKDKFSSNKDMRDKKGNVIYNKFIYVNCKNLKERCKDIEDGVFYTCSLNDRNKKAKLMEKIEFAIRQLRDFLIRLELKEGYDSGGTVKLSICAIHPMEILLFAFQKVLGGTVEEELIKEGASFKGDETKEEEIYKDDLYKGFMLAAEKNAVIQETKRWLEKHNWTIEVEYCGVHQLFDEQATILTEQGKFERKIKSIEEVRDLISEPTSLFKNSYNDEDEYSKLLDDWRSEGLPVIFKNYTEKLNCRTVQHYNSRTDNFYETEECEYREYHMLFPAIEYEGGLYTFMDLNDLINIERTNRAKEQGSNKQDDARAQAEKIKRDAERKEEQLANDKTKEDSVIYSKLEEIKKRKRERDIRNEPIFSEATNASNKAAKEYDIYLESFYQSRITSSSIDPNDIELIEYEGEMLNEDQLLEKLAELEQKYQIKLLEIIEQYNTSNRLIKQLEKQQLDKILTGIQVFMGIASIGLTIIFPPAAMAIMVVTSALSVGCEVVKLVTDEDDSNLKSHIGTMAVDILSVAFIPVIGCVAKAVKVARAAKAAKAAEDARTGEMVLQGLNTNRTTLVRVKRFVPKPKAKSVPKKGPSETKLSDPLPEKGLSETKPGQVPPKKNPQLEMPLENQVAPLPKIEGKEGITPFKPVNEVKPKKIEPLPAKQPSKEVEDAMNEILSDLKGSPKAKPPAKSVPEQAPPKTNPEPLPEKGLSETKPIEPEKITQTNPGISNLTSDSIKQPLRIRTVDPLWKKNLELKRIRTDNLLVEWEKSVKLKIDYSITERFLTVIGYNEIKDIATEYTQLLKFGSIGSTVLKTGILSINSGFTLNTLYSIANGVAFIEDWRMGASVEEHIDNFLKKTKKRKNQL